MAEESRDLCKQAQNETPPLVPLRQLAGRDLIGMTNGKNKNRSIKKEGFRPRNENYDYGPSKTPLRSREKDELS